MIASASCCFVIIESASPTLTACRRWSSEMRWRISLAWLAEQRKAVSASAL
jgi:hypothetical protein